MYVLQAFVSLGCLLYVVWNIDVSLLWGAFVTYEPLPICVDVLLFFACVAAQALRLAFLCIPTQTIAHTFCAVLVGLGMNNLLPAKGGEVLKILYLGKSSRISISVSAGAVLAERFFDANFLYVAAMLMLKDYMAPALIRSTGLFFIACWALFAFFRCFPERLEWLWRAIPKVQQVKSLNEIKDYFFYETTFARIATASLVTLLVWGIYCAYFTYALMRVANIPISFEGAALVFLISAAGQLIPSSPGSLGVFEASVVWGASLLGVEKEPAVGIALLLRMIQFLPTLAAILVFLIPTRHKADSF